MEMNKPEGKEDKNIRQKQTNKTKRRLKNKIEIRKKRNTPAKYTGQQKKKQEIHK
jgi:hypothetical protein